MDTLTHALSGALVARVIAARRADTAAPLLQSAADPTQPIAGRLSAPWDHQPGHPAPWQCVLVGLVAGAFPDIDVLAQVWGDVAYLLNHRGVTHSVLMLPLWAWLVSWVMSWCFAVTRQQRGGWKSLYLVALGGIAIHIAGDWITQFGTMLLAPVSSQRFGLGAMFIIDLSFSGLLLAGAVLAAWWPKQRWPAALGLLAASAWVVLAWVGQTQALAVGERKAQALGLKPTAGEIVVMPRPASPFNWTVSVFDGQRYHVAHVNTRRTEPLQVGPDANFIQRFSAPYQPERLLAWRVVPQFGGDETPPWVRQLWAAPGFDFFRWFAQTPALLTATESSTLANGQTRVERCAWFRDMRFEFPGREEGPFRYGVCRASPNQSNTGAGDRIYKLEGEQRVQVR